MLEWPELQESLDFERALDDLGILVKEVRRGEHMASCPLPSHPGVDANPSFSVNEDKMVWNCFTCDEGGSLPMLLVKMLDFQDDETTTAYQKALEWLLPYTDLADDADIEFVKAIERYLERPHSAPKRLRVPTLPSLSTRVLERLKTAPIEFLEKWNITDPATVDHFQIKYDAEHIRHGYSGPALIIPHFVNGNLVGYQERWLEDDRPDSLPKYTNTTDFPRQETLFNFDYAKRFAPVVVVESVMTVIRLHEAGFPAVSTFGASVKDGQLRLLGALHSIVLAYDNDGPGRKATEKIAEAIDDFTDIWQAPFVSANKGDLADLSVAELEDTMAQIQPFSYT